MQSCKHESVIHKGRTSPRTTKFKAFCPFCLFWLFICISIASSLFIWAIGHDDIGISCVCFSSVSVFPNPPTHLSKISRTTSSITELVSWMQKTTQTLESIKCRSFLLPPTWQVQQAGHPWVCPKIKYNSENRSETKFQSCFHEWSRRRERVEERKEQY